MPSAPRRISVVIPCYNDAALLRRALDSFAAHEVPADEIIVVDNNSTDASAQVAASFAGVRVVSEPRQGITWAAARGYDEARGDVIVRTDADVVVPADYISGVHAVWDLIDGQGGEKEVVAVTGAARFDLPQRLSRAVSTMYLGAYYRTTGSALGHYPLFGSNCVLRTAWWRSVRVTHDLTDPEVHDDLHLSFAVRDDETVWYDPRLTVTMDARALRGGAQLLRRFRRGAHTMALNFRRTPPHRRLPQRGKVL